jgi:hypothetical protein
LLHDIELNLLVMREQPNGACRAGCKMKILLRSLAFFALSAAFLTRQYFAITPADH